MALHGVIADEIFLRRPSDALKETLAHLRREAGLQLAQALALLPDAPPQARAAFLPLAQIGKILKQLEKTNPFAPPLMSRLAVLWTMWRAANSSLFKA